MRRCDSQPLNHHSKLPLRNRIAAFCFVAAFVFLNLANAGEATPPMPSAPDQNETTPVISAAGSVARQVETAAMHLAQRQYRLALDTVDQALETNPFNLDLWLIKGRAHKALHEFDAANEAAQLILAARPDSNDAAVLALSSILDDSALSADQAINKLRDTIGKIAPDTLARAVLADLAGSNKFVLHLPSLSQAWTTAFPDNPVAAVLRSYANRDFTAAGAELDRLGGSIEDPLARGGLQFLVGRIMLHSGELAQAVNRLKQAATLGFKPELSLWELGRAYVTQRDFSRAAATWETMWRLAVQPDRAVSAAVDARLAAGEADAALALLDTAMQAFRAQPSLHARRLVALRQADRQADASAYEKELHDKNQLPGLWYGQALLARRERRYHDAEKLLQRIREFASNQRGIMLELHEVENWLEFGFQVQGDGPAATINPIRETGTALWQGDRFLEALIYWEECLDRGIPRPRGFVLDTAALLCRYNHADLAVQFVRRHIPEMRELDLLAYFMDIGRRDAMAGLARAMNIENAASSWPALLLSLAGLELGWTEEAEHYIRIFAAHPAQPETWLRHYVDRNDLPASRTLTPADHAEMTQKLGEEIIRRRRSSLYAMLAESPQWRLLGGGTTGQAMFEVGQYELAKQFLANAVQANPADDVANLYLAIIEERDGNLDEALRLVRQGLKSADGSTRALLSAMEARLTEDDAGELQHLGSYVTDQPDDYRVRLDYVRKLVSAGRQPEARQQLGYLENRRLQGDNDVVSFLAQGYVAFADHDKALPLWLELADRYPDAEYPLSGIGVAYNH
ncbi:MAG: tetratricopeptide repeat protein, partial [Planctomycetes bacterium]|nr:tetratricopeptide repeat protein [Planctomycetota bacterium]